VIGVILSHQNFNTLSERLAVSRHYFSTLSIGFGLIFLFAADFQIIIGLAMSPWLECFPDPYGPRPLY
jgi:hypothetical protein